MAGKPKKRTTRRGRGEGSIEQLPSGKWRARLPGRRGAETKDTYEAARDWLRANIDKPAPANVLTLAGWLDQWEPLHRAETAAATWRKDEHTAKTHLRPRLGPVRLRDLTALRVRTYFADLKDAGVTPGERFKAGKLLRAVLNAAVKHDLIPANPIDGKRLSVPPKPRPEPHALSGPELDAVIVSADDLRWGPLFRAWADAGLRPSELLALMWDDYDPATATLSVRRSLCVMTGEPKELKTKWSRRAIPLSPPAAAALVDLPRRDAVMFAAPRGGHWWHRNFAEHVVGPVLTRAKVRATPYTFRHTMATMWLQNGVSLAVVAERLGHRDPATTLKHYAHVLPGDQKAAADRMGAVMFPSSSHAERKPSTPERI